MSSEDDARGSAFTGCVAEELGRGPNGAFAAVRLGAWPAGPIGVAAVISTDRRCTDSVQSNRAEVVQAAGDGRQTHRHGLASGERRRHEWL